LGRLSAILFVLPSTMAAGWILGYYLVDRPFSVFPWGSVSMTLVGAGAGLYEILKILVSDQRGERDPHK
jgi:F0F1-type ATP synthase assembly protein I